MYFLHVSFVLFSGTVLDRVNCFDPCSCGKQRRDIWAGPFTCCALLCSLLEFSVFRTFLPYVTALPFLQGTVALLYPPVLLIMIGYIVSLTVGWNISHAVMFFYEYRVL